MFFIKANIFREEVCGNKLVEIFFNKLIEYSKRLNVSSIVLRFNQHFHYHFYYCRSAGIE